MSETRKSVYAVVSKEVAEGIERLARAQNLKVPQLIRRLLTQAIREAELAPHGNGVGISCEPKAERNTRCEPKGERNTRGVAYLVAEMKRDTRVEAALREVRVVMSRGDAAGALDDAHARLDILLFAESTSPRIYSRVDAAIAARSLPWKRGGAANGSLISQQVEGAAECAN